MIYMDNAATTKPSAAAVKAMLDAAENFGNPSSLHRLGMNGEKIVKNAKSVIAGILGVNSKNIYFTSGGTESNNTAIIGYALANQKRGKHLITSKIEHPSVLTPFEYLENMGFEVSYIDVDENGILRLDKFEDALREDTILVSVMHVNNETGMIQPVDKLKDIMKKKSPLAALHVDAVQSFCKTAVKPKKWGADMVSMSAHKVHGIKGCGALYIENVNVKPIIIGGGQQNNMRSGTENVVGIAAFGAAAGETDIEKTQETMLNLRARLKKEILDNIDNVVVNGDDNFASGSVFNVSFLGIKAEILLHSLEAKGIYVSTGSACSSNKPMPSHVLTNMGKSKKEIEGAIRFSLSDELTENDIDECVEILIKEVATIRKYVR